MADYLKFGEILDRYLTKRRRSQAWLAEELEVHRGTVTRWVAGHVRPRTPEQVTSIADLLVIVNEDRKELFRAAGYAYTELPETGLAKEDNRQVEFLAAEILQQLENVDARLNLVQTALTEDTFEATLGAVREEVAPVLTESVASQYNRLISASTIASLTHQLNSYPLTTQPGPVLQQLLIELGVDPGQVNMFYAQLAEVLAVTKTFTDALMDNPTRPGERAQAHYQRAVNVAHALLRNRAAFAFAYGLLVLGDLETKQPQASSRLHSLLEPRLKALKNDALQAMLTEHNAFAYLDKILTDAEQIHQWRVELLEEAEQLLSLTLDDYARIHHLS